MSVYGEGLYVDANGERHSCRPTRNQYRRTVLGSGRPGWTLHHSGPTDEAKQVDIASIYALTKYMQERSCLIFGAAYSVEVVALRLFNVFGPGQALSNPYTGVLANFGARLLHGQPPLVFEDGQQKRDFVHVRDVARAFRLAMESPFAAGHAINIGSGHAYTIARVAELLAEAMGMSHIAPSLLNKARAGDIRHCFADIGKARDLLGFQPEHFLEELLDELVHWIRASDAQDRGEDAKQPTRSAGPGHMTGVRPIRRPQKFGFAEWLRLGEHERVMSAVSGMRGAGASYVRTHLSWAEYHQPGGQEWYDWLIPTLGREFDLLPCIHYTPPSISRTGRASGRSASSQGLR